MTEDTEFWTVVDQFLRMLLNQFTDDLDDESIDAVLHYLEHDEYEMAFEGLFIELIKVNAVLSVEDANKCLKIGENLGINKDSVFDMNFWQKLNTFLCK